MVIPYSYEPLNWIRLAVNFFISFNLSRATMTPKTVTVKDIIERAREAEAGQDLERAAELYEQVIKEAPLNEYAYDRLMILFASLSNTRMK